MCFVEKQFKAGCDREFGTVYNPILNKEWTRHTVYLDDAVRFTVF